MNIALICTDQDDWALGLRSISSVLKKNGHGVKLLFAGLGDERRDAGIFENIRLFSDKSDLIGISSMSRSSSYAKAIIEFLMPLGKPIVWGGIHPTLFPQDCVSSADLICRGEGEAFMVELADRIDAGLGFRDLLNGGYLANGKLVLNPVRELIVDMDQLPLPDYGFEKEYRLGKAGDIIPNSRMKDVSSIMLTGSRGCACSCHYCSNAKLKELYDGKGRFVRKMSISKFVEAARDCRELFPNAKSYYFTDEDFFSRPLHEIEEFSNIYPQKVGLPFECMASPQQITRRKLELFVKAGMWRIDVGVESGSDRIKKEVFNRPATNSIVNRAAASLSEFPQLITYYFFIIGNPYESQQDLLDGIKFLRNLPAPFFIRTYSLVFMPGTDLFERARHEGIIKGLEDSGYELDFVGGYDYKTHLWKRRNLYLNSLFSLMTGKTTQYRLGFIPRFLLPMLILPNIVSFNDRFQMISKMANAAARLGLKMRRKGLSIVSKIIKNPGSIHHLKNIVKLKDGKRKEKIGNKSL